MKRISVGDIQFTEEDKESIIKVLESGRISEGQKVREFEKEFASYIGTKYAVAVSSGTAALIAGLQSLLYHPTKKFEGIKVITSPLTYISTSNAIVLSGMTPVFVDVDPTTFSIVPELIEDVLKSSKDPYIILPVHLIGFPCNMRNIKKIADKYNAILVEDSAQAHGSWCNGKRTGSIGLWGAFSFYIAHNIQAGEMGAITTDDPEIYRLVKKLKTNGRLCDCPICLRPQGKCPRTTNGEDDFDPRFTHDIIGYNFKLMEFQATLGLNQLKKADWIIQKRQSNVKYLNEKLNKYSPVLRLPKYSTEVSFLAYPIVVKDSKIITRKELRMRLENNGVETRPLFGCIPAQQPAYAYLKEEYKYRLPVADYLGKNGFYIGCHQYLEQEQLDYIVEIFDLIMKGI